MSDALLSLAEAARELNVSAASIRRWWKKGLIELVQLPGGTLRVRRLTLDKLKWASKYQAHPSEKEGGV